MLDLLVGRPPVPAGRPVGAGDGRQPREPGPYPAPGAVAPSRRAPPAASRKPFAVRVAAALSTPPGAAGWLRPSPAGRCPSMCSGTALPQRARCSQGPLFDPTWTPVERKARWFNAVRLNAGLLAPRVWGGWGWFTRPAVGWAAGVPGRWGAGRHRRLETAFRRRRWSGCAAGSACRPAQG